jgi:hypothetical protein
MAMATAWLRFDASAKVTPRAQRLAGGTALIVLPPSLVTGRLSSWRSKSAGIRPIDELTAAVCPLGMNGGNDSEPSL